jgi:signal peptidase I
MGESDKAKATSAEPRGKFRENVDAFAIAILMAVLMKFFALEAYQIPTSSMQPTMMGHKATGVFDRIIVDKIRYEIFEPQRWDIAVFRYPIRRKQNYVKRIVGLPGDRIRLVDGDLMVNDKPIDESFGPIHDHDTTVETIVPADHYFVLGDNRPISCDSREFGLVKAELLRGKVRVRFWPLGRFGVF